MTVPALMVRVLGRMVVLFAETLVGLLVAVTVFALLVIGLNMAWLWLMQRTGAR